MGKIYEVCECCSKKYEESEYDGLCSKACADKRLAELGGVDFVTCPYCGKKYIRGQSHQCAL